MIKIKDKLKKVLYTAKAAKTIKSALEDAVGQDIDLTGVDLYAEDLRGVYLFGAVLVDAELTYADLSGANLTNADLTGANLTKADLTGADLTGADLTDVNLTGVDVRRATLGGAVKHRKKTTQKSITQQPKQASPEEPVQSYKMGSMTQRNFDPRINKLREHVRKIVREEVRRYKAGK